MESNKVYDFKDYTNIQLVHNDIAYNLNNLNHTLYKIDLNNIAVATPLNNPTYNPIAKINPPIVFGDKIRGASKIVSTYSDYFCFDINNAYPPKNYQSSYISSDICSFISSQFSIAFYEGPSFTQPVLDLTGNLWYFLTDYFTDGSRKYFIGKLSINNEGQIIVSNYVEGTISFDLSHSVPVLFVINSANIGKIGLLEKENYYTNKGLILYYNNGIVKFERKSSGIQIESKELSMSMPQVDKYSSFINKDNYLYYLEGSSIKRLYLASGSSPEIVYTNNRILTSGLEQDYLKASGNNLIFYQFANDNITVNTYSLPMYQAGAEPKLLSSNSADIKSIVEFNF
jgi:hypothetical protein